MAFSLPHLDHGVIFQTALKTIEIELTCFFYFHLFIIAILGFSFCLVFLAVVLTAGIANLCSNYLVIVVNVMCCQKQDMRCHQGWQYSIYISDTGTKKIQDKA